MFRWRFCESNYINVYIIPLLNNTSCHISTHIPSMLCKTFKHILRTRFWRTVGHKTPQITSSPHIIWLLKLTIILTYLILEDALKSKFHHITNMINLHQMWKKCNGYSPKISSTNHFFTCMLTFHKLVIYICFLFILFLVHLYKEFIQLIWLM